MSSAAAAALQKTKSIWLDCDPGHDDAMAILLATWTANLRVVGISTLSGNQSIDKTTVNAARMVTVSGRDVPVFRGQGRPLIRHLHHDPGIHGVSGLEGSDELNAFPVNAALYAPFSPGGAMGKPGVTQMFEAIRDFCTGPEADEDCLITLVATGGLTNLAMLLRLHPAVSDFIREIVFMGGAMGIGNRHPVAEFNILIDPEAVRAPFTDSLQGARIVTEEASDAPYPVVMIPLEVTHTALATEEVLARIRAMRSPFAEMVVDLLTFFKDTYEEVFNFKTGPPVHDACAIAYVSRPDMFKLQHMRVDVVSGQNLLVAGQTVCDVWGDSPSPKNVSVALEMDVPGFWDLMLAALRQCNAATTFNAFVKKLRAQSGNSTNSKARL